MVCHAELVEESRLKEPLPVASLASECFFYIHYGLRFTVGLGDNTTIMSDLDLFIIPMTLLIRALPFF